MREFSYQYKNLPIPGGGYVTGFIFHKKKKGLLYLRTDIGGTYRFDPEHQRWCSLISHVTPEDYGETFRYEKIPVMIHGNLNGRGTGERLQL